MCIVFGVRDSDRGNPYGNSYKTVIVEIEKGFLGVHCLPEGLCGATPRLRPAIIKQDSLCIPFVSPEGGLRLHPQ